MAQPSESDLERSARYERMWEFEMEAREQLTGRLQFALGLLTFLASILGYWVLKAKDVAALGPFPGGLAGVLLVASAIFSVLAARKFIAGATGQKYGVVPTAKELEDFWQSQREHFTKFPGAEPAEDMADAALRTFLVSNYVKMASLNALNNQARYNALHWTTVHTFWGLALAAAATLVIGLAAWAAGQ